MKHKIIKVTAERTIAQGKYARPHLAAAAYRFNRRFRLPAMLPRRATAMTRYKHTPEQALRMASIFGKD
ncbi:hypothetical protein CKY51_20985 [Xanthomonas maliensis]|nr:hypothetical protein CKY51_20985 [Xanthomonas maliensis]